MSCNPSLTRSQPKETNSLTSLPVTTNSICLSKSIGIKYMRRIIILASIRSWLSRPRMPSSRGWQKKRTYSRFRQTWLRPWEVQTDTRTGCVTSGRYRWKMELQCMHSQLSSSNSKETATSTSPWSGNSMMSRRIESSEQRLKKSKKVRAKSLNLINKLKYKGTRNGKCNSDKLFMST